MTDSSQTETDADVAQSSGRLSSIEASWMAPVRVVTQKFRFLFPYGPNTVEALAQYMLYLLVAIPVIAVSLGIAGVIVGVNVFVESFNASVLLVQYSVGVVSTNVEVAGAIVAVLYLSSVIKYHPVDKNDYQGQSTPTFYEEWESLLTVMAFSVVPMVYFIGLYFEEVAGVLDSVGVSAFVLAWVSFVPAFGLLYGWMHHRYGKGRSVKAHIASLWGFTGFFMLVASVYLGQIAFGFELLVYGTGLGAVFVAHVVMMVFVARRLRWAIYTDWAGFGLSPNIPMWGIVSRGPMAFVVYALVVGDAVTMLMAIASFSPILASVSYIGWRAVVTGDLKKPPTGFRTSPGRNSYERKRNKEMDSISESLELSDVVEDFNQFASTQDLPELDASGTYGPSPSTVQSELQSIHDSEARELSGEAYSEYMEKRDAILDMLE